MGILRYRPVQQHTVSKQIRWGGEDFDIFWHPPLPLCLNRRCENASGRQYGVVAGLHVLATFMCWGAWGARKNISSEAVLQPLLDTVRCS
jgi:hypothetical protein